MIHKQVSLCIFMILVLQKASTQSPPPAPERAPSPSFELGLSSFPPLPGAAGNLKPEVKTENNLENRLSDIVTGAAKDKVFFLLSLAFSFTLTLRSWRSSVLY